MCRKLARAIIISIGAEQLLEEHITRRVSHSEGDGVRSHFGELTIVGVKVQIIGDMETSTKNGGWTSLPDDHLHPHIKVAGASIPVRTLEQEIQTYTRLGRTEQAE